MQGLCTKCVDAKTALNRGRGAAPGAGVFFVSFALGWWARFLGEAVGF